MLTIPEQFSDRHYTNVLFAYFSSVLCPDKVYLQKYLVFGLRKMYTAVTQPQSIVHFLMMGYSFYMQLL